MVFDEANGSETVTEEDEELTAGVSDTGLKVLLAVLVTVIVVLVITLIVVVAVRTEAGVSDEIVVEGSAEEITANNRGEGSTEEETIEDTDVVSKVTLIDFQSVVDNWVRAVGGDIGVAIYDLDVGKIVGEYRADTKFETASLYKLFVVYEGYKQVLSGQLGANDEMQVGTVVDCLDVAVRASDSECAEAIWERIGREELDSLMREEYGFDNLKVSDLVASPYEIVGILARFYELGNEMPSEMRKRMFDSFLNQPATEYDWRQGLPRGFSDRVTVYNKVGWEWNEEDERWDIYNDAAIMEFSEGERHFAVAVMTGGVSYYRIRELGAAIEEYYFANLD